MASVPGSIKSLRKLITERPGSHELFLILLDLSKDPNDRARALALAALLEGALENALIRNLGLYPAETKEDIFGNNGPLRTFSAKIRMAAAIQICGPETRKDLDAVREIRNAFAHTLMPITFETEAVANVCARLTFPSRWYEEWDDSSGANRYFKTTAYLTFGFTADFEGLFESQNPDVKSLDRVIAE